MSKTRVIVRDYRVTIPKPMREMLRISNGTVLEVSIQDEKLIIEVVA